MIVFQSKMTGVAEPSSVGQRSTKGISSPGGEDLGEGELIYRGRQSALISVRARPSHACAPCPPPSKPPGSEDETYYLDITDIRPTAPPSPGGSSEHGERHFVCCSFVGELFGAHSCIGSGEGELYSRGRQSSLIIF